jgi:1,4-alpha-glucan branching enzyme
VQDLNHFYLREPALWEADYEYHGFSWIDCSDQDDCVLSFIRQDNQGRNVLVAILNLTPVPRYSYRVGLPQGGGWKEVINSDAAIYGGSNVGNLGGVMAEAIKCHNRPYSAEFTLPPLSVIAFIPEQLTAKGQ